MQLPKVGDRIRLIEMAYDPCPIEPGTEGTVTQVNVFDSPRPMSRSEWDEHGRPIRTQLPAPDSEAQIIVQWDTSRSLHLVFPSDRFEIL